MKLVVEPKVQSKVLRHIQLYDKLGTDMDATKPLLLDSQCLTKEMEVVNLFMLELL